MKRRLLFALLFITQAFILNSQSMKIMTYNVENLFDTQHDSLKMTKNIYLIQNYVGQMIDFTKNFTK
jgi:hypothetical protein